MAFTITLNGNKRDISTMNKLDLVDIIKDECQCSMDQVTQLLLLPEGKTLVVDYTEAPSGLTIMARSRVIDLVSHQFKDT